MSRDKKNLIYEAALSLIYEVPDWSRIKVADIAARANIGKGTVYEYFGSKEQVIGEALIFMLKQKLAAIARATRDMGFKESYCLMLRNLSSAISTNRHIFNFFTMHPKNLEIHAAIKSILCDQLLELKQAYFQVVEKLVDKSVGEGILLCKPAKFDWQAAVLNSLNYVFLHQQFREEFADLGEDEVLEKAYSAYIKLLT